MINADLVRSGSTEILTHPREIPSLVRRTDDTRALKRAARAERKAAEKPEWDDDVHEATFDDVDDEEVEMHMTFGQDGGEDEDGPINMVRL